MKNKPVITATQLLLMSVGSALVFPYTFMPILNTPPANQDAWIVLIMAIVYIVVLCCPILFLINKFRGIDTIDMFETILGKFFGKLISILFILFFLYCFTACMLITALFINIYIFPETPTWAVLIYMLVPITYAAYKGAGTIGRISTFIVPFVIFTIIIFFLLGFRLMDFGELQPIIADSKFIDLNKGAFLTGTRYSEILILMVFSFWLKKTSSINKTFITTVGVFAICFILILLPILTVLGFEFGKNVWNPYFVYTRQVKEYDFIERMQSLNALAWFPVALLKLILYNFMSSYVLSGVFKAKSHKSFVIPISVIGFILCLIPKLNSSSTVEFLRSDKVFPFVVLPVTFVIPLIVVFIYFLRRKKLKGVLEQKKASLNTSSKLFY